MKQEFVFKTDLLARLFCGAISQNDYGISATVAGNVLTIDDERLDERGMLLIATGAEWFQLGAEIGQEIAAKEAA